MKDAQLAETNEIFRDMLDVVQKIIKKTMLGGEIQIYFRFVFILNLRWKSVS